jgi:DNA repair exonuclease SbcCD nuclease subunit
MTVRIVHTGDNHVDLPYLRYPEDAQTRLQSERMESLRRVVEAANTRKAHVLVVAGDLFDRTEAKVGTIKSVVAILRAFEGEQVLVLPGNHDHCGGSTDGLWDKFRTHAGEGRILVLDRPVRHAIEVAGQRVEFFPCPCTSKTSSANAIGWVAGAEKSPSAVRVGIAHGNVEGLALDDEDRYFNMSIDELEAAGMHVWLLGHVHRPSPEEGGTGRRAFFMAGSSTPESVRRSSEGSAWCIDIDGSGVTRYERVRTGAISFQRLTRDFAHGDGADAIARLEREICAFDQASTVIDLVLTGELGRDDLQLLDALRAKVEGMSFIHATFNAQVGERLSQDRIARLYPEGTAARRLLSRLIESPHPGDAATALHAIESITDARSGRRGGQ